jgi:hypothetical protein
LTLKASGAQVWIPEPGLKGSARHQALFREYREEAEHVTAVALEWWEDTIDAPQGGPPDQKAVREAWECRPAGPASFPGLVALVRDFWLACDRLNQEVAEDERVPPWTFLLGWLLDGSHEQCVSVMVCMPYWPIGLDRDGNWV